MKPILFSTLALTSFMPMAMGADLPEVAIDPPMPFSWAGPYVGVHAGYIWADVDSTLSNFLSEGKTVGDMEGFFGGVHAGYNWQSDQLVFGVEGDLDYTHLHNRSTIILFDPDPIPLGVLSFKNDWQASARLRLGYAIDNLLIYGTGGVAFAASELESRHFGQVENLKDDNIHIGWTVGLGSEYAFDTNWIGRIEARYTSFGSKTYDLNTDFINIKWEQVAVSLGLTYKF